MAVSSRDIVSRLIGVPTTVETDREVDTVGTRPVVIARRDLSRVGITVVNLSGAKIIVGFDHRVSDERGIQLVPGGSFGFVIEQDYAMCEQEYWGYSATANSGIFVAEVLLISTSALETTFT